MGIIDPDRPPPIPEGNLYREDGRVDFSFIRKVYEAIGPYLAAREHWADPYFLDWTSGMSPIERQMWSLIRSQRTPFYPQYPVGRYFVDFGNPRLKIAIECDSRTWHERRQDIDRARVDEMFKLGWVVFSFSGRACMRLPMLPPVREMAAEWRIHGYAASLGTTRFYKIPRGWQDRLDGEFEVDWASESTFEHFDKSLIEYVLEEERIEQQDGDGEIE